MFNLYFFHFLILATRATLPIMPLVPLVPYLFCRCSTRFNKIFCRPLIKPLLPLPPSPAATPLSPRGLLPPVLVVAVMVDVVAVLLIRLRLLLLLPVLLPR